MPTTMPERAAKRRSSDLGDRWMLHGGRVPQRGLRDVCSALDEVDARLGHEPGSLEGPEILDLASAQDALDQAWRRAGEALRHPGAGTDPRAVTELAALLDLLRDAESALRAARADQRTEVVRSLRPELERLASVRTDRQLEEVAAEAICRLGFDRAIISRLCDAVWLPEIMHIREDPQWATEIVQTARENPWPVHALVESEAVRRRAGLIVTDVQAGDRVHRQVADVSLARSYVVSPVVLDGVAVGLLHADCYFQRRHVDEVDRDVLDLFAAAYSSTLRQVRLRAQLDALRDVARRTAHDLLEAGDALDSTDRRVPTSSAGPPAPVPTVRASERGSSGARVTTLSRREVEVLLLLADGHTNRRIASRLVVSEPTVKTHVRNILRKLGAANRAEAVSHWLRRPPSTGS